MRSIIVGTAGHIDHGKSALVRALTGKDPDRLPEEKRRGITIDLGFADLDLGDVRVGFVDVPGHERFVKNMLAGAHGIDVVALVIAADEGVMPQTREHFAICRLLGVSHGLIVLTKTDLAEDEMLPLVESEVNELVAGSFLQDAPIVRVSSKTGAGLAELKASLRDLALSAPERSADFVTRLPIDRAFSMKGFGTVVTGTLVSGEIKEGDELELLPPGISVRVRGTQVHGETVKHAVAGQRTAVNLGGVDLKTIERGMVLAPPGRLRSTQIMNVRVSLLGSAPRALRPRSRVRLHLGAAEVIARVRILENSGEIKPGETRYAQLRLEAPVIALHDERFVLRSYSPAETIGGGVVLDPLAPKHRSKDLARVRAQMQALENSDRVVKIATFVAASGETGLTRPDLVARTGWTDEVLSQLLTEALAQLAIVEAGLRFINPDHFTRLSRAVTDELAQFHQRNPLARGLARESLREKLFAHSQPDLFRAVITMLESEGQVTSEKEIVRATSHNVSLSTEELQLRAHLEQTYREAGVAPPALEEALRAAPGDRVRARKILQLLIDAGTLVRVQGEMFFHREALEGLTQQLRAYAANQPERMIDVASFKALAGVSRKYAIPLLEYFDRERVTQRQGDRRLVMITK